MSGWDQGAVYTSDQNLKAPSDGKQGRETLYTNPRLAQSKFKEFIRWHREGNVFRYRDQLLLNFRQRRYCLDVELEDLHNFDSALKDVLQEVPNVFLPHFEEAARDVLRSIALGRAATAGAGSSSISGTTLGTGESALEQSGTGNARGNDSEAVPLIQVTLSSKRHALTNIRGINASHVNRLLKVPGIVSQSHTVRPKATVVVVKCKKCNYIESIKCPVGGVAQIPKKCARSQAILAQADPAAGEEGCGLDSYVIQPDLCTYVDTQTLKLQECPEDVPTGEMPRTIKLQLERSLAGQAAPGTRISIMAISCVFKGKLPKGATSVGPVRNAVLKVVGLGVDGTGTGRMRRTFKPEDEEQFLRMSRQPDIYDRIYRSISPSIAGSYTDDIKKAIACLLFGGSRKILPDGMKLRGDINVLMLGDPSTAKSQFLKFAEKAAPIGVYTSGKGSSAAGLTASVLKDKKGDFYLEAGAMVLADGGVVCIDEFDKMREQDRVAIHEAMEQQTISIAKAGITTILNSRVSVLAAANPVYGRYQDDKTAAENINFLPSILSRFDMIFIVRDVRDEERDQMLARHIMSVQMNAETETGVAEGEIELKRLQNYVAYCRQKCAPRLSLDAAQTLRNHYVRIRQETRIQMQEEKSVIPITVRQLEAITRIAESLAKMSLVPEATQEHVNEAIRLFKVSTLRAAKSKTFNEMGLGGNAADAPYMQKVEDELKRRVAIGHRASVARVRDEFTKQQFSLHVVNRTLDILVSKGDFVHKDRRQTLVRVR